MLPIPPPVFLTQSAPAQGLLEIQPGLFVHPVKPTAGTPLGLRPLGITHVIDLRTAGEGEFTQEEEAFLSQGGTYLNCPVSRDSMAEGLKHVRALLASIPPNSRTLVRCASGNRAGAALFVHWILDRGMAAEEAMSLARRAGLRNPATEQAAREYVASLRLIQEHR